MEVREDDTWICTFPKSGTTWTEEMVWGIKHGLDHEDLNTPHIQRIPYLEYEQLFLNLSINEVADKCQGHNPRIYLQSVDYVKTMRSPRIIKTHLPFSLLPLQLQNGTIKPKIIVVNRDPMDTCISYYHHSRSLGKFQGTLDDYVTLFINDAVLYAPFWLHYFSFVENKEKCNILFLKYEDMVKPLRGVEMLPAFTPLPQCCDDLVTGYKPGSVYIRCQGVNVFPGYREIAENILKMEVRGDDTWICTFPKSGTTWTEEMVWCIKHGLDHEDLNTPHIQRIPYLEYEQLFHNHSIKEVADKCQGHNPRIYLQSVDYVKNMRSPRIIKTHLPFSLLPLQLQNGTIKPKIIVVNRDPMDTCISYYHHSRSLGKFQGTLVDYVTLFINDAVLYAPFWLHYFSFVENKEKCNILFLKYEDMVKDLPSVIQTTAAYLGVDLLPTDIERLCTHLSFAKMKDNPATNMEDVMRVSRWVSSGSATLQDSESSKEKFLRKGTIEQWKSCFTEEMIDRFEVWIKNKYRYKLEDTRL